MRAIACPRVGGPTGPYTTFYLNHDVRFHCRTQPHQIAYPGGGQAMARRLRLVPGLVPFVNVAKPRDVFSADLRHHVPQFRCIGRSAF